MSPRGRKRQHNPSIPAHIDQAALPRGVFWDPDRRRWYMKPYGADGKRGRKNIASELAKLSDLHRIAEATRGIDRKSVGYVCEQFQKSKVYGELASATQADYDYCQSIVDTFRTKRQGMFNAMHVDLLKPPNIQVIVDRIAEKTPSKANHLLRYLRRVFAWAIVRGYCTTNPAEPCELTKERRKRSFPSPTTMATLVQFAADSGRPDAARKKGGCPPYLWALLDLAYLCRLRSVEVRTLTDANALPEGVLSNRRKGSRDNVTEWTPRLRAAWDAAASYRDRVWEGKSFPVPIRAEHRPLFVAEGGGELTMSGVISAFRRLLASAVAAGKISEAQ